MPYGRDGAVALLDQVPRKVEKNRMLPMCGCTNVPKSGKKIVPRRYRKKCSYICRSMCFRPLRAGYIPNSQAQAGKFDALITERLLRAVSRFIAITAGCIPIHERDARLTSHRWRACRHWGHDVLNAFKIRIEVLVLNDDQMRKHHGYTVLVYGSMMKYSPKHALVIKW